MIYYNPRWGSAENMDEHTKRFKSEYRWVENLSDGLRAKPAHEVISLDHTGWFVDELGCDTTHGAVVMLPRKRYAPAVADPQNPDCYLVNFGLVSTDARSAAHWADSMAREFAEDEREWDRKARAEERLDEAKAELERLQTLTDTEVMELGRRTQRREIEACKEIIKHNGEE